MTEPAFRHLAIIGQGLIGSSITRAVYENDAAARVTVTDGSPQVRQRVRELGIGAARVAETAAEAVDGADLVVLCVPVGQIAPVCAEIADRLLPDAIVSDVGSVKVSAVSDMAANLRPGQPVVGAHPLAGTEFSGPDAGLPRLFVDRWCILTPAADCADEPIRRITAFWEMLGSEVAVMTPRRHDEVLSLTSHLPHLIAFSIFHTALRDEQRHDDEVIKFSAGGFRDFTRIASSNPTMWRDIFIANREPVLAALSELMKDLDVCREAIEQGNGEALLEMFSTSRITRRSLIEREHITVRKAREKQPKEMRYLARPYSSD